MFGRFSRRTDPYNERLNFSIGTVCGEACTLIFYSCRISAIRRVRRKNLNKEYAIIGMEAFPCSSSM